MYIVISALSLPLLSQRCNINITTIAVTLMCTSLSQYCRYHCCPMSQRCARFRCHSAVLVFSVTALCTSFYNRCGIPPVSGTKVYSFLVLIVKICCLIVFTRYLFIRGLHDRDEVLRAREAVLEYLYTSRDDELLDSAHCWKDGILNCRTADTPLPFMEVRSVLTLRSGLVSHFLLKRSSTEKHLKQLQQQQTIYCALVTLITKHKYIKICKMEMSTSHLTC